MNTAYAIYTDELLRYAVAKDYTDGLDENEIFDQVQENGTDMILIDLFGSIEAARNAFVKFEPFSDFEDDDYTVVRATVYWIEKVSVADDGRIIEDLETIEYKAQTIYPTIGAEEEFCEAEDLQ